MGRSWLGSSIRGLASQFADLPPIAQAAAAPPPTRATIPALEPLSGFGGHQIIDMPSMNAITRPPAMGLEATGLARDPRVAATSFLDNALSPIAQSPRSMMAPGPIRAPGLANSATGASAGFGGGGALSNAGGEWATLDALNPAIASAASQTGVPANLIKAMLAREGSFGKDKYAADVGRTWNGGVDHVYAFNGIFQSTADSYGIDWNRMQNDDSYAVWAMGRVLQGIKQNNPTLTSWDDVAGYYFAGPNYNNPNWGDETGQNTVQNYKYGNSGVITRWHQLDGSTGSTTGGFGDGGAGSSIVDEAKQYTGVPYIWGHIPGASEDPWKTGWDCSGFTKFLSDKYGDGSLPAGSHQQYADTVAKGLLVSDPNQLQAGDLVFFDTGDDYASNINRASHVGMYIGGGQFIQAANPSAGTIISNLSDYINQYGFLGGRKMAWSGGGGGGSMTNANPGRQGWRQWLNY
jgi:cell wall-associated NlpC family hydrolase